MQRRSYPKGSGGRSPPAIKLNKNSSPPGGGDTVLFPQAIRHGCCHWCKKKTRPAWLRVGTFLYPLSYIAVIRAIHLASSSLASPGASRHIQLQNALLGVFMRA